MIEINNKVSCCGCSGCMNICPTQCISMIPDKEGFLYPNIDKINCVNCGACEKVCPVLNCEKDTEKSQKAFLLKNNDNLVRKQSTSGGAFTAIAEYVLNNEGVVFGAAFDEDFNVFHKYIENKKDLAQFRNSKYVQSNIGNVYSIVKKMLEQGRMVCFSGTPCQVEGLLHFLGKKSENLILVDFVCHAVPSPLVWEKYKIFRKPSGNSNLVYASFRDKSKYGYQYSQVCMKYSDGYELYCGVESDPYFRAFLSDLIDRPSCYSCVFKKRYRVSDLTIWDCFDVYKINKDFDDNQGVTRILSHSDTGNNIIKKLQNCTISEIDTEVAVSGVVELVNSVSENPNRENFFIDCNNMEPDALFKKWFPDTFKVKLERVARKICGKTGIYKHMKRIVKKIVNK